MLPDTVGRPMEILLVEDDLLQARLTTEAIKRGDFRHRTTLVRDGEEAMAFLLQRGVFRRAPQPDLVLLDLRLPKMDGLDVLAEIRSEVDLRAIPVVIMTSSPEEEDRMLCEQHSVEAYLDKPVDLEKFLAVLGRLKRFWKVGMTLPEALTRR